MKTGSKDIGFSIQWVNGTYTNAEESFVRINSSGTNLSDWEIKLVRYRQSSFARLVTSIAHPEFTDRCWPRRNEMGELLTAQEQSAVTEILEQSELISSLLWEPRGVPNGNRLRPLLVPSLSEPASTPLYVGELLTVVQGEGGRTSQTEELMRRDLTGDSETLLSNGRSLAQKTLAALHHLRGKTVLSMGIVSSAYFYNADGIAIRSLFYGFLYWINYGAKDEILLRKRIFSAHRDGFEKAYLLKKKEVITRISRKSGSGGEVTLQTARYFNGLLQLVVDFVGRIDTPDFDKAHQQLLIDIRKAGSSTSSYTEENLGNSADVALRSRVATRTQRAHLQLASELEMMPRCEICGGRMLMDDLLSPPHIDHKKEHSEGGATSVTNLRPTHPFCNHQRREIESLKVGRSALPSFVDSKGQSLTFQLDFLTLWDEEKEEEEDEEFTPDISEDVTRESGLETTPSLFGEN